MYSEQHIKARIADQPYLVYCLQQKQKTDTERDRNPYFSFCLASQTQNPNWGALPGLGYGPANYVMRLVKGMFINIRINILNITVGP